MRTSVLRSAYSLTYKWFTECSHYVSYGYTRRMLLMNHMQFRALCYGFMFTYNDTGTLLMA